MPYLSFDLDALDSLPDVARRAGIDVDAVAYGLLRLWRHAWREKTDTVTASHLPGFFPGEGERVTEALTTFGFVEKRDDGTLRVRGAERYLRVSAARAKGAAAANAKRGLSGTPATQERRTSDAQATHERRSEHSLTPSSEQRAANREPTPTRANATPLGERLCATFQRIRGAAYEPSFADQDALRRLLQLAKGDEDEIERRYALGLRRTRFPLITTWVDLSRRWNDCATPEQQSGESSAPTVAARAAGRTATEPCGICGKESNGAIWGVPLCAEDQRLWHLAAKGVESDHLATFTLEWTEKRRLQ